MIYRTFEQIYLSRGEGQLDGFNIWASNITHRSPDVSKCRPDDNQQQQQQQQQQQKHIPDTHCRRTYVCTVFSKYI